jgi:hypothetical protein
MSELLGLFEAPEPVLPELADEPTTPGERRRAKHLAAIGAGQHPLSVALRIPIRLHPDARRDGERTTPGTPRCGDCVHRGQHSGAHEGRFPKCHANPRPRQVTWPDGTVHTVNDYPRITNGIGTDCASWWPACTDYEPDEGGT